MDRQEQITDIPSQAKADAIRQEYLDDNAADAVIIKQSNGKFTVIATYHDVDVEAPLTH